MKVYLAGSGDTPWHRMKFYDFYRLDSFLTVKGSEDEIHRFKGYMLDSGAFSFIMGTAAASKIDWERYAREYANFVKFNNIPLYVELDIDEYLGLDEVERLRGILTKQVGWSPLPVWHVNRGYDYWLKMVTDYDYVCFGSFLSEALDPKKFIYIKQFLNDAEKKDCKVHGLGFTRGDWMQKLPFYSVDSSSWSAGVRFGLYSKFENGKIVMHKKPPGTRIKNRRALAMHDFKEWLKFARYAERYL